MADGWRRGGSRGHPAAVAALWVLAVWSLPKMAASVAPEDKTIGSGGTEHGGVDEASVMHQLRQAIHGANLNVSGMSTEVWDPGNPAHPCTWAGITCYATHGPIQRINLFLAPRHSTPPQELWVALPPKLAQLPRLEELSLRIQFSALAEWGMEGRAFASIPQEWGLPGAFPSLKKLWLEGNSISAVNRSSVHALPDIQEGALPALRSLTISLRKQELVLPASWGASPAVLPALHTLLLEVRSILGQLPAGWARGFRRLASLDIRGRQECGKARVAATAAATAVPAALRQLCLPSQWASASAFPRLLSLSLSGLDLQGVLPDAWQHGGFPVLQSLVLTCNSLQGTLPADIFASHSKLSSLKLSANLFQGTLPDAWGTSQAKEIVIGENAISGPAFPPAWLAPGALPSLEKLSLQSCPHLSGTLPSCIRWPKLNNLAIDDTRMMGSIPATWCNEACAPVLWTLSVYLTMIDPAPPPCLSQRRPHFKLKSSPPVTGISNPGQQRPFWPLVEAVMTLALAGAATAVACAAWRHGRLRFQVTAAAAVRTHGDSQSLLLHEANVSQQRRRHGSRLPSSSTEAEALLDPAGGGAFHSISRLSTRRAQRLAAALRAELRCSGGVGPGGGLSRIELTPLEALPRLLAHKLLPPAGPGSGGQAAVHAGETGPLPLPPEQLATEGPAAAGSRAAATLASDGHGVGIPPSGRRWGLPIDSLRVAAEELEFTTQGPSGELVELGKGAHGVVCLAKLHGRLVAAKVFDMTAVLTSGTIWQEVSMLRMCTHPRIVTLHGVAIKGPLLVVCMELMQGGSLRDALQHPAKRQELRWAARGRQVAADVAEALDYLHTHLQVMHSDLKAANVLLSADYRASLADLGMAQALGGANSVDGLGYSIVYGAPEQLMGERVSLAADIYSFGILLVELTRQQLSERRGAWDLPRVPDDCPQAVLELIQACISNDPRQRPTAAQVRQRLLAEPG